jgi:hypothetical protein
MFVDKTGYYRERSALIDKHVCITQDQKAIGPLSISLVQIIKWIEQEQEQVQGLLYEQQLKGNMRFLTVPLMPTIERLLAKDISRSKKYLLVLNVLVYVLTSWRAILDFQFLLQRVLYNYKNKLYGRLVGKFILDYLCMASKFFIRRFMYMAVSMQWKEELTQSIDLYHARDEMYNSMSDELVYSENSLEPDVNVEE